MEPLEKTGGLAIVPMEQRHIQRLAVLEKECFSNPWSENALAAELQHAHAVFLVAEVDGEAAGYVGMHHILDQGDICSIAVFPQYRRQGVARQLLLSLFQYGEQQGLRQIMLEVRQSNMGAQALYAGLGFVQAGRRKNFYTEPMEDALLMQKAFAPFAAELQ